MTGILIRVVPNDGLTPEERVNAMLAQSKISGGVAYWSTNIVVSVGNRPLCKQVILYFNMMSGAKAFIMADVIGMYCGGNMGYASDFIVPGDASLFCPKAYLAPKRTWLKLGNFVRVSPDFIDSLISKNAKGGYSSTLSVVNASRRANRFYWFSQDERTRDFSAI
jgi:hypothetical protein